MNKFILNKKNYFQLLISFYNQNKLIFSQIKIN
jgi:hypothetical protein